MTMAMLICETFENKAANDRHTQNRNRSEKQICVALEMSQPRHEPLPTATICASNQDQNQGHLY